MRATLFYIFISLIATNYAISQSVSDGTGVISEEETNPGPDNSILYLDFAFLGQNVFYNEGQMDPYFLGRRSNYSFNFKLGHNFYFGPGSRKFRVGIDLNYISINLGPDFEYLFDEPEIILGLPSLGLIATYHINNNMRVDFKTNSGAMITVNHNNWSYFPFPSLGIFVNPQLNYSFKRISTGVQYLHYRFSNSDDTRSFTLNHFSIMVGFRF